MNESIREAIAGYEEVQDGIGHYIKDLIEGFGVDAVYEELWEMLRSSDTGKFFLAIEFTSFIYENLSYIPGKADENLINKMRESHLFEDLIEYLAAKKYYYQLDTLFSMAEEIPLDLSADRVEELIRRYKQENCILLLPLMELLFAIKGNVFPKEKYDSLNIEDPDCNFIIRYLLLQSATLDAFCRNELLEGLKAICPQKYVPALEKSIAYNKLFMREDYFADGESGDEGWEEIQAVVEEYFCRCEKLSLSGESLRFEDFVLANKA